MTTKHLPIRKEKRRLGMVLGRCRHLPLGSRMGQECLNLDCAHFCRMAFFAMKQDVTQGPVEVRLAGCGSCMTHPQRPAHVAETLRRLKEGRPAIRKTFSQLNQSIHDRKMIS